MLACTVAMGLLLASVHVVVARSTNGMRVAALQAPGAQAPSIPGGHDSTTQVLMRNVNFYVDPDVVLHIHALRGTMTSRNGGPIVFDDKRSFVIHVADAEVGLTGKDLSALLNKYVFKRRAEFDPSHLDPQGPVN